MMAKHRSRSTSRERDTDSHKRPASKERESDSHKRRKHDSGDHHHRRERTRDYEKSRDRSDRDRKERDRDSEREYRRHRDRDRDRSPSSPSTHKSSHRESSHRHSSSKDDRLTRSEVRDKLKDTSSPTHAHTDIEQLENDQKANETIAEPSKEATPGNEGAAVAGPQEVSAIQKAIIDTEEKIRQRRERVEAWRQKKAEEEAAKKAEEAAALGTTIDTDSNGFNEGSIEHNPDGTDADENHGKGWNLEDDEDDDEMEVDSTAGAEPSNVELPSFLGEKKSDKVEDEDEEDKVESLALKAGVKRGFNFGFGNKKNASSSSNDNTQSNNGKSFFQFGQKSSVSVPANTPKKVVSTASKDSGPSKVTQPKANSADTNSNNMMTDEDEVDPLDAFMVDVSAQAREIRQEDLKRLQQLEGRREEDMLVDGAGEVKQPAADEDFDEEADSGPEDILAMAAKKVKKKDIAVVDHSQVTYEPFRKNFYIEPPELRDMTADQVDLLRIDLDAIKIRGADCPKPVKKWTHCGLPSGCLEVIKKLNYTGPTAIQSQAIPAIMSGRDVIGVAKTGSGKTIAFLLPMFRHIKDQRPLEPMEGPIAVIMTPTRELAVQIYRECKPFLKVLSLRAVCAYGGSPIKDQIADLKRGAEVIVCTPGRMIDLLTANSGRVTNLKRVTYIVLDEADRMFDMGFEPQVMKIVNNVRPDRQTVLFSATFPRQMEALARKVLRRPLEITVGGRSVVAEDVTQIVEVREENTKFIRLLEILGEFYKDDEHGRTLIFVDRHESADRLLADLMRRGYYLTNSLHGGKDQADRDSTIADFKSGVIEILIATSIAARGLDVKQLKLVVNYEVPNHLEDYVHRVGRTGRAGNKGTAYTFITPEQDKYATDILKALKISGQAIPDSLQRLADDFQEKVKAGNARISGSGFGGKGLDKFDKERDVVKKLQKKLYGGGEEDEESEEEEAAGDLDIKPVIQQPGKKDQLAIKKEEGGITISTASTPVTSTVSSPTSTTPTSASPVVSTKVPEGLDPKAVAAIHAAQAAAARINAKIGKGAKSNPLLEINARFKDSGTGQGVVEDVKEESHPAYCIEMEINDYPQKARWKVTNKEQITQIVEISGAAITTRGTYFPKDKQPGPNERKLYLFVEGDSELVIDKAQREIKRILREATEAALEQEARGVGGGAGRYSVV